MKIHGDYMYSWSCPHPENRSRVLLNGETACDCCMHVTTREDGEEVKYRRPLHMKDHFDDEPEAAPETTIETVLSSAVIPPERIVP